MLRVYELFFQPHIFVDNLVSQDELNGQDLVNTC